MSEKSSSRTKAPISRFSSTVMETKTLFVCGTQAMPARTRSCGDSAVMSSPFSRIWPARSGSIPNIAFIAVDLPAPLGPTMTAISPLSTAMVQE